MNGSILTNQGAMVALQTMKSINKDLSGVQDMISTGKKVATSKDNAAIWAISSVMESDVSAFKAVGDSLALGQSTVSVARNASEQVKDSLVEIKAKIIAAQEENVDRDKIQSDVDAIRSQIKSIVGASQFNGLNLLKSSEDLNVLSSIDRASNGSVTTSNITIAAKSLDSGTAATSTAGTTVLKAVNGDGPDITATLGVTAGATAGTVKDGKITTQKFTNNSEDFVFATSSSLDEGDAITFTLAEGSDSVAIKYTQTAGGTTTTNGQELAAGLKDAYKAFVSNRSATTGAFTQVDSGTAGFASGNTAVGDFKVDSETSVTYFGAKGKFEFTIANGGKDIKNLDLKASGNTLTVTNTRDTAVTFDATTVTDRVNTDTPVAFTGITAPAIATGQTASLNLSGTTRDMQKDDVYTLTLGDTSSTNSVNIAVTNISNPDGNTPTSTQLATILKQAIEGFAANETDIAATGTAGGAISGNTDFTYGAAAGQFTHIATGAKVTFSAGAGAEGTLQTALAASSGTTVLNPGDGILTVANSTGAALAISAAVSSAASTATSASITVTGGAGNTDIVANTAETIGAGTLDDAAKIDINNLATQDGDTISVTIQGANVDVKTGKAQPITYTVPKTSTPQTATEMATGLATAINTQLEKDGITDFVAKVTDGANGIVTLKNFNNTTTRDVSAVGVVNELSNAVTATDSSVPPVAATTIAAGGTNKVTFAKTSPSKGDTYSIGFGGQTFSYTARADDDLNDVGRNLEGLIKIQSTSNVTVDFTAVDDPKSQDSVLTIKNNSETSITGFSATAKSGGKAGGGLELLDQIDVSTSEKAEGSLDLIEGLIEVAISAASAYGSSEKRLESQQEFISKLTDSLKSGIGSLVDANLEETSARLQALQVQQQLGTQALSIANQAPQSILSLFR